MRQKTKQMSNKKKEKNARMGYIMRSQVMPGKVFN